MTSRRQQKNHDEFTATLPSAATQMWRTMVEDWNVNQKAPNPYVEHVVGEY